MKDPIERQMAIDALHVWFSINMITEKDMSDHIHDLELIINHIIGLQKVALRQLPSAQPKLGKNTPSEQHKMSELWVKTGETCTDAISRQDAIEKFAMTAPQMSVIHIYEAVEILESIPSAQPAVNEWCHDCKEYDADRHSCPRWNRVIRQTVEEAKIIHCKDCKHWMNEHLCKKLSAYYGSIDTDADFFCGYAERRSG